MHRNLSAPGLALALFLAPAAYAQPTDRPPAAVPGETALPQGVALGGAFSLTDQAGRAATDRDLRGRWALLYFGYTFCPDVCPTELQTMAAALDALGPELGERVRPVFVSIDPERDTPERLADYVALFHPRLIGLTGSAAHVAQAARAYRVYYARARPGDGDGYLMDHSSFIYLLDPDGAVRGLFRPGTTAEDLAAALRRRLP
ncbi:SCO family protein [Belnapia sp. T18]|uniref:SCO family protein n=1 Tax=Belnapia arida TaxID=2804533 RepID=A0ABS1U602_9PROT|nr:SCO family protein [Belnapia arida]MBL6080121.1 SCO family protein [Belnapia arida]